MNGLLITASYSDKDTETIEEQLNKDFNSLCIKFYQVLSTCKISDQLDYSNRNYRGGKNLPPPSAIPICEKPGLFRVNPVGYGGGEAQRPR